MKNYLKRLSERIDALSLRERAFLFLSVIALCVALADQIWVAPAQAAHRRAMQSLAQEDLELRGLRLELRAKASQSDPAALARAELLQLRAAIATADQDIGSLLTSSKGSTSLADALVHFLRRHGSLALLHTGTLAEEGPGTNPAQSGRPGSGAVSGMARQGLELTVAGPYPDLVKYVQTLESAMPQLRWGGMKLAAQQQPPELTLQVFLLGPQP